MRVVEVGANRGVTAVAVAREVGMSGHVYAFEAVPEYCTALRENLARNGATNASAHCLALSRRRGRIRIYEHGEGSGIAPAKDASALWVEATTLAEFLAGRDTERIDLLNLDCEGSELLVFQGAKDLLVKQAPQIFCELHHASLREVGQSADDVVAFLEALGYDVQPLQVEEMEAASSIDRCSHIYARRN
jgi:FkbM family methyltransferase